MPLRLIPGENAPLAQRVLHFAVAGGVEWDLSALVVAENLTAVSSDDFVFYNQTHTAGVQLRPDGVHIDLNGVHAHAHGVLCIVSVDAAADHGHTEHTVVATLSDPQGTAVAELAIPRDIAKGAVICFELYRRAAQWKVRAVGQGYAGGLPQLLTVHEVDVDRDVSDDPGRGTPPTGSGTPSSALAESPIVVEPLDQAHPLERMSMIFEDAARTTAALLSARDYAAHRLDEELSNAVADPTTRNGPAAKEATARAQSRYDDLITVAQARYEADANHLTGELNLIDDNLPRSMSSWDSASWQSAGARALPSDGIRLGQVCAVRAGGLTVPLCVPVPLRRPLWIDTPSSTAATAVVTAIVLRLLAATPVPAPILDVVDLTGALETLTGRLERLLGGDVVRSHHEVSAKLADLADAVDLAELAVRSGLGGANLAARVVVLSDFGYGLRGDDLARVATLVTKGVAARLSLVVIGNDESTSSDPQLRDISQYCEHLSVEPGDARILDPWTRNEWLVTPDSLPADGDKVAQFISTVAAL